MGSVGKGLGATTDFDLCLWLHAIPAFKYEDLFFHLMVHGVRKR